MHFVGRGNRLTGIGLNYGSLDDPYKDQEEAMSLKITDSIWNWFLKVWLTRFEVNAIVLIEYTRWVSSDISGRVREWNSSNNDPNFEKFKILRFPAEKDDYSDENDDGLYDPRELDEPLDRNRLAIYAQAKKDPNTWMAMYQQTPLDVKGLVFEMAYFGRYDTWMRWNQITISIDANYKEKSDTPDRAAIEVWGRLLNKSYLIEFVNKKLNYTNLRAAVIALINKYPGYWAILVEEAANGYALIDDLRKIFPRVVGVIPHGKSKFERVQLALPVIHSGGIMLPTAELCPNIGEFLLQISRFTGKQKNEQDDLVDAMVQDINYREQYSFLTGNSLIDTVPRERLSYYGQVNHNAERGQWQQSNVVEVRPTPLRQIS